MTEQEKQILIIDLSARLPYGIFVKENRISLDNGPVIYTVDYHPHIYDCKPYLRPLTSMTEEEKKEFVQFHCVTLCPIIIDEMLTLNNESNMFDWLNKHHFDYRGLISMGLAIDCTDLNIY